MVGLTRAPMVLPERHAENLTVFAVDFIRAIHTVPDAVALPAAMDTATIFTFKLVRSAGSRSYGRR